MGANIFLFVQNVPLFRVDVLGLFDLQLSPNSWKAVPWSFVADAAISGPMGETWAKLSVPPASMGCQCKCARTPKPGESEDDLPHNMVCWLKVKFHVLINKTKDGSMTKEKRYGHEQLHMKNLILYATDYIDTLIKGDEADAENISLTACGKMADATSARLHKLWNDALATEANHGAPSSTYLPQASTGYDPIPAGTTMPGETVPAPPWAL